MDFSAISPATGGQVELLELLWPPLADADGQRACVCYVLMVRASGLLLCVPGSFFSAAELAADGEEATTRPGPSLQLQAPAVALSEEGDWIAAPSAEPLSVTVVDFPASVTSPAVSGRARLLSWDVFQRDRPRPVSPLASDVLRQARQWILAEGAGASSGYQTAASEPPAGDARRQRAKRPTVALLAQQQASLTEVVARLSDQLAMMQKAAQGAPADRPDRPAPTRVTTGAEARRAPLSEHLGALGEPEDEDLAPQHPAQGPVVKLPPFQTVPKSLAHALGPPPPARPAALIPKPPEVDLDAQLAAAISSGELPNAPAQPDLTTAMMAQSQALLTLVGHLAQGTDPVLDPQSAGASSSRGSQTRQRLQAELSSHSGTFQKR